MKFSINVLALAVVICGRALADMTVAEELTAEQLVAKVVDARKTSGFRIRAKLIRTTPGSEIRDARQLLIKGRRDGEATKVLYQILWPTSVMGQTLVIEQSAQHKTTGFLFEPPDKVTPLTPQLMAQPFFGSDLAIEDLAEDFWHWPQQKLVGDETVGGHPCKIIEARPPTGVPSGVALVKTWIAPEIALPLRVEKFDHNGRLLKRITADKIIKQSGNRWTATTLIVEPAGSPSRTVLEGSRSDRDLDIPAEDFTLEKIKAGIRPSP